MNPAEINAPPSLEQLYAMYGEKCAENLMLKLIIAQHPEIIASHNVAPPAEMPPAPAEEGGQELGHPGPGE